jgi:outer membrane protein OmpA-like peptidoglycan-associated protein
MLRSALALFPLLLIFGCANKTSIVEVEVKPPQPVSFVQDVSSRNLYTKAPGYVMCFGADCDRPTPKHLKVPPQSTPKVTQQGLVSKPVVVEKSQLQKEFRQKDSIEFIYNTTNINKNSMSTLASVIGNSKSANQIYIVGYAGLTEPNAEYENRVLGLALARARLIEKKLKDSGFAENINVSAELVKCKNEDECLDLFRYGGRRADIEILTIGNGE